MSQITIALLGITGTGISATGNTILKNNFFRESYEFTSCSKLVKDGDNIIDGCAVTVYDNPGLYATTPGLYATDTTSDELMKRKAVENCDALMYACKNSGVNVFVFVLSYNNRFSKEEVETVEIYEAIFGAEFLKTNGILVFTNGDCFDPQENGDFKTWCNSKTGEIKKCMNKFGENIILISNKGSFDGSRGQDGSKLLKLCFDKINIQGPYTVDDYNKNESSRKKLLGRSCSIV